MIGREKTIAELISDHEARNASLRRLLLEKNVDFQAPRKIECHFWTWSGEDATALADSLQNHGFEILVQRPAAIPDDPMRWNLEASVTQSVDLTLRREFTDELVTLAHSYGGVYDGWGTHI